MEENNIPIIYSKHNYPGIIRYSPRTRRYFPDKYTI
jgi:hypothetical protein